MCWREYRNTGSPIYCWWETKMVKPLWKTLVRFLKRKILIILLSHCIRRYFHKRNKNRRPKKTCTWMFIPVLFIIAPNWKQSWMTSTSEWINKLWNVYTMKHCSAIKGNKVIDKHNMGTFQRHFTKWKKPDTKLCMLYNFIYMKF